MFYSGSWQPAVFAWRSVVPSGARLCSMTPRGTRSSDSGFSKRSSLSALPGTETQLERSGSNHCALGRVAAGRTSQAWIRLASSPGVAAEGGGRPALTTCPNTDIGRNRAARGRLIGPACRGGRRPTDRLPLRGRGPTAAQPRCQGGGRGGGGGGTRQPQHFKQMMKRE